MGAGHLEIPDAAIAVQLFMDEARGILHELDVGTVHFRERLLVLTLDHHLRLGLQRIQAVLLEILDGELGAGRELHLHPGLGALGVRNGIDPAVGPGVLGKFRGAWAGGGVNEVEVDVPANGTGAVDRSLKRALVILPSLEAAAEGGLEHGVGEAQADPCIVTAERAPVVLKKAGEGVEGEDLILVVVERAHDPGHVDALQIGLQGHRAADRGLERVAHPAGSGEHKRQAEVGDAHLMDADIGALDRAGRILHVRQ